MLIWLPLLSIVLSFETLVSDQQIFEVFEEPFVWYEEPIVIEPEKNFFESFLSPFSVRLFPCSLFPPEPHVLVLQPVVTDAVFPTLQVDASVNNDFQYFPYWGQPNKGVWAQG